MVKKQEAEILTLLKKKGQRGSTLQDITFELRSKVIEKYINEVAGSLEHLERKRLIAKFSETDEQPRYKLRIDA